MENKSLKIGILGLGLIGGSILKSLKKSGKYYLIAVSNSSYKKAMEFADVSTNCIESLKNSDVVFVCTKMNETLNALERLNGILQKNAIVADVCSIKGFLNKEYNFNFIPSHPMAGIERYGFENSRADLFGGAKWIVCKKNNTLEEIIKTMGAVPLFVEKESHDDFAAQISHFPSLMAISLFDFPNDGAKKIAASGFRDMTRLCLQSPDLTFDMLNLNRENIKKAYKIFQQKFEEIINSDEETFKKKAEELALKRSTMYDKDGKNIL